MHLVCLARVFVLAVAPSFALFAKGGTVLALPLARDLASDFFLRHPQPRTIAVSVWSCDVKSGALYDGVRDQICERPAS